MGVPYGVTKDGYESQFGTNVVGHFAFTKLLLPVLESTAAKSPPGSVRVISTSSDMYTNTPPDGIVFNDLHLTKGKYWNVVWKRYAQSKLGVILMTNELVRRFASKGIYAVSIHPGVVKTNLAKGSSMSQSLIGNALMSAASCLFISPQKGCLTQLFAGTSSDIVDQNLNGSYLVPYGKVQSLNKHGKDVELSMKLWEHLDLEVSQKGI